VFKDKICPKISSKNCVINHLVRSDPPVVDTKFFIDKKGMIQFKNVGFEGPKMLDEMTAQIDMLLDDSFYELR